MRKMKSFPVWTCSLDCVAWILVFYRLAWMCNHVRTNYSDTHEVSVLHNAEGFPGVEGNFLTFGCWSSKNVFQPHKVLVESFSTCQIQKTSPEHSPSLFRVFGGCAWPPAGACSSLLFFCLSHVEMMQKCPRRAARYCSHACPNSQVTKLFLECKQSLLEEGKKKTKTTHPAFNSVCNEKTTSGNRGILFWEQQQNMFMRASLHIISLTSSEIRVKAERFKGRLKWTNRLLTPWIEINPASII